MARTMLEETKMKIGKEQVDRLPDVPIWHGADCAKMFAIGVALGMFIGWLLAH